MPTSIGVSFSNYVTGSQNTSIYVACKHVLWPVASTPRAAITLHDFFLGQMVPIGLFSRRWSSLAAPQPFNQTHLDLDLAKLRRHPIGSSDQVVPSPSRVCGSDKQNRRRLSGGVPTRRKTNGHSSNFTTRTQPNWPPSNKRSHTTDNTLVTRPTTKIPLPLFITIFFFFISRLA
jgi:hypothetical protein